MKKMDEQKFIDNKKIELYKEKPKEGEFFGYIGDINFLIPKIYNNDTEEYVDFTFSKQEKNDEVFPMFFKMVSNELAMEISTGILFLYNPKIHQENDTIMSDLDFESKFDKYAKVIRNNLDEFNNILNKKSEQARHIFNYEMQTIIDKRNMETVKVIK